MSNNPRSPPDSYWDGLWLCVSMVLQWLSGAVIVKTFAVLLFWLGRSNIRMLKDMKE